MPKPHYPTSQVVSRCDPIYSTILEGKKAVIVYYLEAVSRVRVGCVASGHDLHIVKHKHNNHCVSFVHYRIILPPCEYFRTTDESSNH